MRVSPTAFGGLTALYLGLVLLPFVAMAVGLSPAHFGLALEDSGTVSALWLSLWTSLLSLLVIVGVGTPVAWWLRTHKGPKAQFASTLLQLPIVIPPAVIGVALLSTLGPNGELGGMLDAIGIQVPFSPLAVILAQVLVASPFYIQAATNAFRAIQPEQIEVAVSFGASPVQILRFVALPIALPGLLAGGMLAWARALGEFGATLLFAGNLPGQSQTLPLLIYSVLERDLSVAAALSLIWALFGVGLLLVAPAVLRGSTPTE
ncbi:MAG: ABC transporter permease [Myxococcota bacterium]|nr:ABC transporter permease [Myxococcota bacterium]